jgi:hypothetical protein
VFEDLIGWRLSGAVEFRFPAGFRLQAGETVVVAAAPDDLKAAYGITNVLGPYSGSLPHDGGRVRLRNNADAIRLDVEYLTARRGRRQRTAPGIRWCWPGQATRADPRAWAASEFRGGSPGHLDPTVPAAELSVVINEFLAHTDDPVLDFIELHNGSNVRVDLSGMVLTDDPAPTVSASRMARSSNREASSRGTRASSTPPERGGRDPLPHQRGRHPRVDAIRFDAQRTASPADVCPMATP